MKKGLLGLIITLFIWGCEDNSLIPEITYTVCTGKTIDSTIYYVGPDGNDENDGLAASRPFLTIEKGISTVKNSGTVRILPGTYKESVGIYNCGDTLHPISIEGFGGEVVLDGENIRAFGLFLDEAKGYQIANIRFSRFTDAGMVITQSQNIQLDSVKIDKCGGDVQFDNWGLEGYGIRIERSNAVSLFACTITQNGPANKNQGRKVVLGAGVHAENNQGLTIALSQVANNTGAGIRLKNCRNALVIQVEAAENDVKGEGTEGLEGGIWVEGGSNIRLIENNLHDHPGPGLRLSSPEEATPFGYDLIRNSSTANEYGVFVTGFDSVAWPDISVIQLDGNNWTGNTVQDEYFEP